MCINVIYFVKNIIFKHWPFGRISVINTWVIIGKLAIAHTNLKRFTILR